MTRLRFDAADAQWRVVPRPGLGAALRDWLTRGGSLTAHLATLGAVSVRVTREAVAMPWADELAALAPVPRQACWVREVVLSVDGEPCVAAHSLTPLGASRGVWQAIRWPHMRPLAELLYNDVRVSRSALVSRCLIAGYPLHLLGGAGLARERAGTACVRRAPLGIRAARHAVMVKRVHAAGAVAARGRS